jgi:hypothetical protein
MRSIVDDLAPSQRLSDTPLLAAVEHSIAHALMVEVVAAHAPDTRRCRRLPYELTLLLVIAMNLFARDSLPVVLTKLLTFVRLQRPDGSCIPASKGGISRARARLGIQPVADLFHRVCRPLATPATVGAFLFGLRLMAIDTFTELVPDTPANERAFGRHRGQHGQAGFPQVLTTALVECGTHATVDVSFGPCHSSAPAAARRLLRSVTAGMLLLVDSGLCSVALVLRARAQGAHVLGRIGSTLILVPERGLLDGSYLTRLYDVPPSRRTSTTPWLLVRVIVYTLDDPDRPGMGETHRLLTTLLDPVAYPARDVVLAYHERWEIELTIDEIDTHQRPVQRPLRSKTPSGVIQELYGLLLAHYVVRSFMHEAACRAEIDPDRMSFVAAVGALLTVIPVVPVLAPPMRERLHEQLLDDLLRLALPPRDLRSNPRTIKRKTSKFRHRAAAPSLGSLRLPFVHAVQVYTMGAALSEVHPFHRTSGRSQFDISHLRQA